MADIETQIKAPRQQFYEFLFLFLASLVLTKRNAASGNEISSGHGSLLRRPVFESSRKARNSNNVCVQETTGLADWIKNLPLQTFIEFSLVRVCWPG